MRGKVLKTFGVGLLCLGFMSLATQAFSQQILLLTNVVWKYNIDAGGLDGTGWEENGYDDFSWSSGNAILAGGESNAGIVPEIHTVLPAPNGQTYYYRTTFNWPNAPTGVVFTFTNRVDDGCVVYLNGVRIYDVNVSTDPALFATLADGTGPEATPDNAQVVEIVDPPGLLQGDNVLAVSVHQASSTSSDSVFGMSLNAAVGAAPTIDDPNLPADVNVVQGRTFTLEVVASGTPSPSYQWYKDGLPITDETNPTLTITDADPTPGTGDSGAYYCEVSNGFGSPLQSRTATVTVVADTFPPILEGGAVRRNGTITLQFDEAIDDGTINSAPDPFGFFLSTPQDPAQFLYPGTATVDPNDATVVTLGGPFINLGAGGAPTNLVPGFNYTLEIAPEVLRDVYNNLYAGTPAQVDLPSEAVVFDYDKSWLYYWNPAEDLITNSTPPYWDVAFDDSSWTNGPGLLGEEGSTITDEDGNTISPPATFVPGTRTGGADQITSYYRTTFVLPVAAANVQALEMLTWIDDGAIIHLNGEEVLRIGMADGERDARTLASRSVGNASVEGPFSIPIDNLVDGENLLAVEVHQTSTDSSDCIWGAKLFVLGQLTQEAPTISQDPVSPGTINEYDSFALSVEASGTPPLSYQWQLNGTDIADATNSAYSVASAVPSQSGTYRVIVSNLFGSSTSADAALTVTADTVAPVVDSALATTDPTEIVIELSEAVTEATGTNIANYAVALRGGGASLTVLSADLSNGDTTVTLTTDARNPDDNYTLTITGLTDLAETPNVIAPNPTVVDLPTLQIIYNAGDLGAWAYYDLGLDLGLASAVDSWATSAYDDSGWTTGLPSFYNRTPGDGSNDGVLEEPLNTRVALENLNFTNDLDTTRVITYYYRNTLTVDDLSIPLYLQYMLDDGAVFYINGQEVHRFRINEPEPTYTTLATTTSPTDQTYFDPVPIDMSPVVAGDNLIAVEVHQASPTSSDIAFALRILGATDVTPELKITSIDISTGDVIIEHNGAALGVNVWVQEDSDGLGVGTGWTTLGGGPHPSGVNLGPATGTRFFQLTDMP